MLKGKKIVLGITGSIAAYKACLIIRGLIKQGAEVQTVITPAGKEFITPITLSALTHKPVISEFFSQRDGTWNSHVDLGLWADAMLIAPCTASTIGKMANGIADNMLITTYLSMKAPVFVAPAMDLDMYAHPSTQKNLDKLRSYGNIIISDMSGSYLFRMTVSHYKIRISRMTENRGILQAPVDRNHAVFDCQRQSLAIPRDRTFRDNVASAVQHIRTGEVAVDDPRIVDFHRRYRIDGASGISHDTDIVELPLIGKHKQTGRFLHLIHFAGIEPGSRCLVQRHCNRTAHTVSDSGKTRNSRCLNIHRIRLSGGRNRGREDPDERTGYF